MIKNILNSRLINSTPSRSVVSAAFVITLAGLTSRIIGLFRDRLLASKFGAGDTLDVYYAAFRIPDLIYNLLILGALSAAFIPVFTSLITREKEEDGWKMANGIISLAIVFISVISIIFSIFTPQIMKILTPGFSAEKMSQVVAFTRIMFLSPLFLGISGILGGILTSYKKFLIYSLAPIFYNLGIIFGIILLVPIFGASGLAWGVVAGALMHMIVQIPTVASSGHRFRLQLKPAFFDSNVRKVIKLMIPRTLGIAVGQINLMVITIFASMMAAGSLAIFNFAQNLQSVPLGIFGISFSIAAFPVLASLAAKNDFENFIKTFSQTFRQILFFVIPMSVFILALRAQLVRVVLGSGKFDWEDTILTFQCLGIFVLSLFAQSLIPLLARAFYALHDTRTPFYVGLFSEAINIITVILLIGKYQIVGLVMAFSIASTIQMLLLLYILRTRFENMDDKKIILSVCKVAIASIAAGLVIQGCKYLVAYFADTHSFLGVFSQLFISGSMGFAVFIAICYAVKLEEFFQFKESINKRIFREKKVIEEDIGDVSGI